MPESSTLIAPARRMISIIIPVLREAGTINSAVAHLRQLYAPVPVEIIVVDGEVGGDTLKAVCDDEIKKIISPRGRAGQMNAGAAAAEGDVLLFLHADTMLPPDGLAMIRSCMDDVGNVAGAFRLGINTGRKFFRITERYVALRTRLTRIPFGDQAIFIRKEYFEEIGGYRDIPIMEDVELMGRIKRRGDKIRIIPRKALTSPRRWEREGIVYATLRNWMLQILYVFGVPPERLAKFYR